jgi:hypothetical protein
MDDRNPKMVELDAPRPLKWDERALLDFLLDHPIARDELRAQAERAEVVSECDCGCRSVGLEPHAAAPSARYTAEDSVYGRDDYIGIRARGRSEAGTEIEVTLHVVHGRMAELEIWDGAQTGGRSRGELPELDSLYQAEQ